jgi:ABC-type Fe3+-citrate transport system substrate-binding protein
MAVKIKMVGGQLMVMVIVAYDSDDGNDNNGSDCSNNDGKGNMKNNDNGMRIISLVYGTINTFFMEF